jgi:hypothetical protein
MRTTTVSGQTEDSYAKRFVWNVANRIDRGLRVNEATGQWTYTTATIRQANGATGNQVAVVVGLAEDVLSLHATTTYANSTGGILVQAGIGDNSTTAYASGSIVANAIGAAAAYTMLVSRFETAPSVGYHPYMLLEFSTATGTTTFYGTNLVAGTGLSGRWKA